MKIRVCYGNCWYIARLYILLREEIKTFQSQMQNEMENKPKQGGKKLSSQAL